MVVRCPVMFQKSVFVEEILAVAEDGRELSGDVTECVFCKAISAEVKDGCELPSVVAESAF